MSVYLGEHEGLRSGELALPMVNGVPWDTVKNQPLDDEGLRRERAAAVERDRYTAEIRQKRTGAR